MATNTTPDGYPLPLRGKAITDQPVVAKKEGVALKEYPEFFIPGDEKLEEDEMRITCLGSGNPIVRKAQAAASWLVELGNGENFIFDIGGGAVQNLWSLSIPPANLDKLFITHLHLDHVGDFHVLFDAMAWGRNTPLHVWGASGYTKEMGIESFCDLMHQAALWHIESKRGFAPSTGAEIVAHEFDANEKEILVYDENGVKVYSYAVLHCIFGSRGYRLEWNDLSFSFSGDASPSTFDAEHSRNVDVFVHEAFLPAEPFAKKSGMPLEHAQNVISAHTTPDILGEVFNIAEPKLGVGYHYFIDDDTVDPFFAGLRETYDKPVVLAEDLMVINVTKEQIVSRMAETNPLAWPAHQPKSGREQAELASPSEAKVPDWLSETRIEPKKKAA